MASHIDRRKFLATLLGGAAARRRRGRWRGAQQRGKLRTIGFLGTSTPAVWSPWSLLSCSGCTNLAGSRIEL
jgi:hypothetical protein